MNVAIRVDITEACADRIIDKEQICKFIPGTVVQGQGVVLCNSVRPNLHQGAILGTTSWPTVEPYDSSLPVRNVVVLKVPEKQVAIGFRSDLDVTKNQCQLMLVFFSQDSSS